MIEQEEENHTNTNQLLRPRYRLVVNKCKLEHQEKNRFEICSRMYYKVPQNNSFVNTKIKSMAEYMGTVGICPHLLLADSNPRGRLLLPHKD